MNAYSEQPTLNRRQLIQAVGGALAMFGLAAPSSAEALQGAGSSPAAVPVGKARVGFVFCVPSAVETADRVRLVRSVVTKACPKIDFTMRTVRSPEEAGALVREARDLDGYLVWSIGRNLETVREFTQCDRPVVVAHDGYSGR